MVKVSTSTKANTVNLTNNAEAVTALKRIAALKAIENQAKAAKAEREALEATVIRPLLGDATEGIVRGVVAVKVSSERTNNSIDQKLLAEAWPEAFAQTHRETKYTFLTVNIPASLL